MQSLRYGYDFGDDWQHKIEVGKVLPVEACALPICIGSANACPPEDVDGTYGYADFLEAITDPAHPEHQDLLDWCGGAFDPKALDPDVIERRLRLIKL